MANTVSTLKIGNIFDVLKMKLPSGGPLTNILNALAARDDFMAFTPAFPANEGLTHHALRTISLPTGYLVDIGGSWKASKAQRERVVEVLATVRSSYQAPTDTFTTEEPAVGKALLRAEKIDHIMMLNQSLTRMVFGNAASTPTPNQSGLVGFAQRAPYAVYDNKFTFDVGGRDSTSDDLRSIWMMKPGVDTVHYLYNKNHPTLGIEMVDKGEVQIQGLGDSSDEHRYDIFIEFMLQKGVFVRDQRALKRICNIPAGVTDNPGADLFNQIINASIINAPTGGTMQVEADGRVTDTPSPWIALCDERVYAKLVIESNNKFVVLKNDNNIYRTKLPMIGDNIIIARQDSLNYELGSGEAEVAAA